MSQLFDSAKQAVEAAIATFGVEPARAQVAARDGEVTYSLTRGSAVTLVSVVTRPLAGAGAGASEVALRVLCPVMTLPTEERRPDLFRRLLELNTSTAVGGAAFGLAGGSRGSERVVVVSERPAQGLDADEAAHVIKRASAVADTYDDRLVREFGGERASDVRA